MSTEKESQLGMVCRYLREQQVQGYLVGGAVRDMLLGRETADIDIAVSTDGPALAESFARYAGGSYVLLDELNHVGRVVFHAGDGKIRTFDFSTLRGTIDDDLKERDFTVNAIAVDLNNLPEDARCFYALQRGMLDITLIDPLNGQIDIQDGTIRAVGTEIFKDDPVRLLRAVRLAAELNFEVNRSTEQLIKENTSLITSIAGERVRDELLKLLAVPGSGYMLRYLDELGLLTMLVPELIPARETTQPREHHWKVLEHSINTAIAVDFLVRRGSWLYEGTPILASVPWSEQVEEHLDQEVGSASSRLAMLKLAAVLHDIAKPRTKAFTPEGRTRFIGHEKQGAETAAVILSRLRFSVKEIKLVELYIRYHLRPTQLTQEVLPSRHALYRYFRDTGAAAIDILFLSLADHLATRGPDLELKWWEEHTKLVEYVISQYYNTEELVKPPKLIDGNDLITIFGMKAGPVLGAVLETVREAAGSGEISSREEALQYIRKILIDRTGK